MGQCERSPWCDYYLVENKLQESSCKRDLGVGIVSNLSYAPYIWRIVKEVSCFLANTRITFKYMDMFVKLFITHIKS